VSKKEEAFGIYFEFSEFKLFPSELTTAAAAAAAADPPVPFSVLL
jgi:hypothetical protein